MHKRKPLPQQVILPSSLLGDTTKQSLQVLIPKYGGVKTVPADLGQNDVAALAFHALLDCFHKAGNVAEGELKDILWGFEQCGLDPRAIASGLTKLRALGYVYYTDPLGQKISEHNFDPKKPIWLRYSEKFMMLLVRE